jgi:hypothetical protein
MQSLCIVYRVITRDFESQNSKRQNYGRICVEFIFVRDCVAVCRSKNATVSCQRAAGNADARSANSIIEWRLFEKSLLKGLYIRSVASLSGTNANVDQHNLINASEIHDRPSHLHLLSSFGVLQRFAIFYSSSLPSDTSFLSIVFHPFHPFIN